MDVHDPDATGDRIVAGTTARQKAVLEPSRSADLSGDGQSNQAGQRNCDPDSVPMFEASHDSILSGRRPNRGFPCQERIGVDPLHESVRQWPLRCSRSVDRHYLMVALRHERRTGTHLRRKSTLRAVMAAWEARNQRDADALGHAEVTPPERIAGARQTTSVERSQLDEAA